MMVKTRAIVLHSIKYSDAQLIVDFLTEIHGRLSFLVRLPKTSNGIVKRQYFQPMMLLDVEYDYRPSLKLQKLRNIGVAYSFATIPFSSIKIALSLFLAEFLLYATKCEQGDKALFGFVYDSFVWLDRAKGEIANFHLLFLARLTTFLGLGPNLQGYDGKGYFDLQEGCFVSEAPTHSHFLPIDDSMHLFQFFRLRYETMHLYAMSRKERYHCIEVIVEYYRLHVPNFPELKSLSILQSLFS